MLLPSNRAQFSSRSWSIIFIAFEWMGICLSNFTKWWSLPSSFERINERGIKWGRKIINRASEGQRLIDRAAENSITFKCPAFLSLYDIGICDKLLNLRAPVKVLISWNRNYALDVWLSLYGCWWYAESLCDVCKSMYSFRAIKTMSYVLKVEKLLIFICFLLLYWIYEQFA